MRWLGRCLGGGGAGVPKESAGAPRVGKPWVGKPLGLVMRLEVQCLEIGLYLKWYLQRSLISGDVAEVASGWVRGTPLSSSGRCPSALRTHPQVCSEPICPPSECFPYESFQTSEQQHSHHAFPKQRGFLTVCINGIQEMYSMLLKYSLKYRNKIAAIKIT